MAIGATASFYHLTGDVEQIITGKEAKSLLVQVLIDKGVSPEDANKYQAYVDAGAIVVTVSGGIYSFVVNTKRVGTAAGALKNLNGQTFVPPQTATNRTQLISDLINSGTKITPKNVVDIRKLPDGRTVWLETGNSKAGLEHIAEGHAKDFAARGVSQDQIPALIFDALENGHIVGSTGTGRNARSIYETTFNGVTQRVAVGVSENGFVVTAHPF